jgi:hypothetical protein
LNPIDTKARFAMQIELMRHLEVTFYAGHVGDVLGGFVVNAFQPKSMVEYRCGHGLNPSLVVRLASNNTGSAMFTALHATPGYSFPGRANHLGRHL